MPGKEISPDYYDVIIVGGGLAGLTLSCLLGCQGVSVACIDQSQPVISQKSDLRTTAISYGSQQVLKEAGIWDVVKKNACPIKDIQIIDGDSPVLLNFLSSEVAGKSFGWITGNAELRHAMIKILQSLDSVIHIAPAKVKDFSADQDKAGAILEDGTQISGRLLIGADGRGSPTREWMEIYTRSWSYNQRAVICNAVHANPHNNVAVEHFWPQGPFAILPMSNSADGQHRSSVVFTEHGPENKSLMHLDDESFEEEIAQRFPDSFGAVHMLGKRACYPLGLVHASSYIGQRMALVADAAHGIHPIAGQGLNLGFRDIKAIGDLVINAHNSGRDIGSEELLIKYQRRRRFDNMTMAAVTDGLVRLFSNNIPPMRFLRRAGLKAVSKIPPAKRFFMRRAMGDR